MTTPKLFGKRIGDIDTVITETEPENDGLPRTIYCAILEGLDGFEKDAVIGIANSTYEDTPHTAHQDVHRKDVEECVALDKLLVALAEKYGAASNADVFYTFVESVMGGLMEKGRIVLSDIDIESDLPFWARRMSVSIHPNYIRHIDEFGADIVLAVTQRLYAEVDEFSIHGLVYDAIGYLNRLGVPQAKVLRDDFREKIISAMNWVVSNRGYRAAFNPFMEALRMAENNDPEFVDQLLEKFEENQFRGVVQDMERKQQMTDENRETFTKYFP